MQITVVEGVENTMAEDDKQHEHNHGGLGMLEHMVEVPFVGQVIESLVFDAPAAVGDFKDGREGQERGRTCGGPCPR